VWRGPGGLFWDSSLLSSGQPRGSGTFAGWEPPPPPPETHAPYRRPVKGANFLEPKTGPPEKGPLPSYRQCRLPWLAHNPPLATGRGCLLSAGDVEPNPGPPPVPHPGPAAHRGWLFFPNPVAQIQMPKSSNPSKIQIQLLTSAHSRKSNQIKELKC
jgi:hypothetical protein